MSIPNSPDWAFIGDPKRYEPSLATMPSEKIVSDLYDVSLGPENLSDSKGRIDTRYWIVIVDKQDVFIKGSEGELWGDSFLLFSELGFIEQLSLTFDQLGRPLVFYRLSDDSLKLYWYSPLTGQSELKYITQGGSPRAGFDLVGNTGLENSDAMLFYVRGETIYMRVQRDRFDVEYETPVKASSEGDSLSIASSSHSEDIIGSSYTLALPGGAQEGDLAIATIMHRDTLTLPTGWELISATTPLNYGQVISMVKRIVEAVDIDTQHTFTQATSQRMAVGIAIVSGSSEYAISVLGEVRYTPQNKGTIATAGSEHQGGVLLAAATVPVAKNGITYTYATSGGVTYLGNPQFHNRLGLAWAKIPDGGVAGGTLSHGESDQETGASLSIVVQGLGKAIGYKDLDIISTGMRVDNRYQVVYQYHDENYVPPPPQPPLPPALNGDYIYMQASATQFGLEKPLITSAQHDDISITFNIYGVNELLETLDPKWGAYGIPIFCEGGTTTLYPIPLRYNQFIFLDGAGPKNGYYINPVRETQLRASRKFSLAFMYINNALHLILVVNGKKYAPIMPFNLSDGRWTVAITGNTLTVLNDATTLFIMEIDRGQDGGSEPGPGRFGAYSLGTLGDMWRQNFRGALYGITVNIAGVETNYPLMTQNSPTQESYPPGNNITIYNHKPANWKYMLA